MRTAAIHFSTTVIFAPHLYGFEEQSCLPLHDAESTKSYGMGLAIMKFQSGQEETRAALHSAAFAIASGFYFKTLRRSVHEHIARVIFDNKYVDRYNHSWAIS